MMLDNLNKTYALFAIFAGILVFASTVGFILKQKAGSQSSPVIDNAHRDCCCNFTRKNRIYCIIWNYLFVCPT